MNARLSSGKEAFLNDELINVYIIYHLQLLGEAARHLPDELRNANPDIPWKPIISMRNVLIHEYFTLSNETIWNTVERDLPVLKQRIVAILNDLPDDDD